MPPHPLDPLDQRILAELQRDARLTNVELARRVHLSPSPCLARVRALEQRGVIKRYVTLLEPRQVDLARALGAIQARVLLLPGETDLYFRVADNAAELPHLRHGEMRVIPSINGHRAGNPQGFAEDTAFLKSATRAWLDA